MDIDRLIESIQSLNLGTPCFVECWCSDTCEVSALCRASDFLIFYIVLRRETVQTLICKELNSVDQQQCCESNKVQILMESAKTICFSGLIIVREQRDSFLLGKELEKP